MKNQSQETKELVKFISTLAGDEAETNEELEKVKKEKLTLEQEKLRLEAELAKLKLEIETLNRQVEEQKTASAALKQQLEDKKKVDKKVKLNNLECGFPGEAIIRQGQKLFTIAHVPQYYEFTFEFCINRNCFRIIQYFVYIT